MICLYVNDTRSQKRYFLSTKMSQGHTANKSPVNSGLLNPQFKLAPVMENAQREAAHDLEKEDNY